MRLFAALTALVFVAGLLSFAQGQEVKAPGNQEVKKDAGDKQNPADPPKTDDKGKDDPKKDDKKDDPKKDDPKKNPPPPKYSYWGTFVGKITSLAPNGGEMSIEVTYKQQVPHADAAQRQLNWQKDLASRQQGIVNKQIQIAQEKNPQTRFNLQVELQNLVTEYAKAQAKPPELFYLKDATHTFIVRPAKNMKLRVATPELEYDKKGNPVPMTKEKIKQLQGPEGFPGFPSETAALQTNQLVSVYLDPPKGKDTKKDPKKKGPDISDIIGVAGKGDDKDKKNPPVVDDDDPSILRASVIVIRNDLKQ